MPLPMPRLDARTFDQLLEEGQALLPHHAPAWTDYNIHDPGVTLMELLAWLVEMDFYRLDRTTDASTRAFLRLAGIEPRPATVAETALVFQQRAPGAPIHLPAGIQIASADGAVTFQTAHHLDVLPAKLTAVLIGKAEDIVDRTADNETSGRRYAPFGLRPRPGQALYLGFDKPLTSIGAKLSLYVWAGLAETDRELRGRLMDECAAERAAARSCLSGRRSARLDWREHYSARTVWEIYAEPGEWKPLARVTDMTRGLTLSGVVRFPVPVVGHAQGGVNDVRFADRYFIRCRLARGRYDCPPEIAHIALNAVPARHAMDGEAKEPFTSTGRAGQVWRLLVAPIVAGSTRLRVRWKGKVEGDWREAPNWDRTGPHDRAYVLSPETGEITFGNGRRGRVPPAGAEIQATYQVGGGPAGNIPAERLTQLSMTLGNLEFKQPFAATGGADAETLLQAKTRTVAALAAPRRTVTLEDFKVLALETPGVPVARAHAIADYDPVMPCLPASGSVTVVVVPPCPEARPEPRPDLLRAVARALARRRPVTTELHIIGPSHTTVAVHARLYLAANADSRNIAEAARRKLDAFFHPLHGGPDGKGWPIGRNVYRAEVMALLNDLPGVTHVDEVGLRVEAEVAGADGLVTFMQTITMNGKSAVVRAQLHVGPDVTPGELAERARVELVKLFQTKRAHVTLNKSSQLAEVQALLGGLPGVDHAGEISLDFGHGLTDVCENVSICPHGLVASGDHRITVAHRDDRIERMRRPASEPCPPQRRSLRT